MTILEIVSWGGHIFLRTEEHGILVREGDKTYRMKLEPFRPKPVKNGGTPPPGSEPEPPPAQGS